MTNATLQSRPETESSETQECVHYWIIDTPAGPMSLGKCRRCGESREFKNYMDSFSSWDEDRTVSHVAVAMRSSLPRSEGAREGFEEDG